MAAVDPYWQQAAVAAGTWQVRDAVGATWMGDGFSKSGVQHTKNQIFDSMFPAAGRANWANLDENADLTPLQRFQRANAHAAPLTPYEAVRDYALGSGNQHLRWAPLNAQQHMPVIVAGEALHGFTGLDCGALDPLVPDLKFGVIALNHSWRLCAFLSDHHRIMLMTGAFLSNHEPNQPGYHVPVALWNAQNKALFQWLPAPAAAAAQA